jgi:predicted dinucleotide-binding enzyme
MTNNEIEAIILILKVKDSLTKFIADNLFDSKLVNAFERLGIVFKDFDQFQS